MVFYNRINPQKFIKFSERVARGELYVTSMLQYTRYLVNLNPACFVDRHKSSYQLKTFIVVRFFELSTIYILVIER